MFNVYIDNMASESKCAIKWASSRGAKGAIFHIMRIRHLSRFEGFTRSYSSRFLSNGDCMLLLCWAQRLRTSTGSEGYKEVSMSQRRRLGDDDKRFEL